MPANGWQGFELGLGHEAILLFAFYRVARETGYLGFRTIRLAGAADAGVLELAGRLAVSHRLVTVAAADVAVKGNRRLKMLHRQMGPAQTPNWDDPVADQLCPARQVHIDN